MPSHYRGCTLRRVAAGLCGLLLIAVPHAPTAAQTAADPVACGVTRLGSVPLATFDNVPTLTLLANHRPITLVLDTGAQLTVLTPAAAARIAAQPPRIEISHRMRGIGGSLATSEVELTSFAAGPVELLWRRLLVAPITIAPSASGPLDGLLGADQLGDFDIELDLPAGRVGFYRKQTCLEAAPGWDGRYSTIMAGRSPGGHLFFPVRIDGRAAAAIIDTGAQRTAVSASAARALGVSDAALALDRPLTARGAAGERLLSRVHRFACLEVAGEAFPNAELMVTDIALQDADIVLGADFLAARRLWLSYGSRRIFVAVMARSPASRCGPPR